MSTSREMIRTRLELIAAKAKLLAAGDWWHGDLVTGLREIIAEAQKALDETRDYSGGER